MRLRNAINVAIASARKNSTFCHLPLMLLLRTIFCCCVDDAIDRFWHEALMLGVKEQLQEGPANARYTTGAESQCKG